MRYYLHGDKASEIELHAVESDRALMGFEGDFYRALARQNYMSRIWGAAWYMVQYVTQGYVLIAVDYRGAKESVQWAQLILAVGHAS